MSKSDKLKEILNTEKPTIGTDPMEPWSVKYNVRESEEGLLKKYFLSRGINPNYVSKETRIAHAKTGAFDKWKRDHMALLYKKESLQMEPTPVQKRKGDLEKSEKSYKEVRTTAGTHDNLHKEEIDSISEDDAQKNFKNSMDKIHPEKREKARKTYNDARKSGMTHAAALTTMHQMHAEEIENLEEVSSELLDRYKEKAKPSADSMKDTNPKKFADRWMNIMKATGKQIEKRTKTISDTMKKAGLKKEDAFQDSNAATQMPFDTGNNPADAPTNSQLSKKAEKVVKKIKESKVVKEDLYDHEKDNKPPQNVKQPSLQKNKEDSYGSSKSDAAIVMSGGKTMTGEPRDTIEIDPMLKKPKGGDVNSPETVNKTDKKENK